jgi:perosamine synthetase
MQKKLIKAASPDFRECKKEIIKNVSKMLSSNNVSNGNFTKKFENEIKKFSGAKYISTVNSGGSALELAIKSLNINGKEIILPTQTFIASANAISRAGCKPVFCDIDPFTGCMDLSSLKNKVTKNTKAVMFVYMFGIVPTSVLEIKNFCKKKKIYLIEDAAHAHGGKVLKKKTGSIGDIGCFSFYSTKILSIGEGGAVTTNNKKLYTRIELLKNYGRVNQEENFREISNNFRLSEVQAILGLSQAKFLKKNLKHRNKIAKIYIHELKKFNYFEFVKIEKESFNTFWRFPVYLRGSFNRSVLQKNLLKKHNIKITWMYYPLCHQQQIYKTQKKKLPLSEKYIKLLINLPTHTYITSYNARIIAKKLIKELENQN